MLYDGIMTDKSYFWQMLTVYAHQSLVLVREHAYLMHVTILLDDKSYVSV